MASERENFDLSGPLHLDTVDWRSEDHRRSIAASLVQGVYILERDRQMTRDGSEALAPPWWEFFHFHLLRQLVDTEDSSIFGAIFEYKPPSSDCNHSKDGHPIYVISFRGTMMKPDSLTRDLLLDFHFVRNGLHLTSRSEIAIQAVRNMVAASGASSIWLTGHSLGAAMAMLAGKTMAKTGIFLESYLFNPPYFSAPIERIKDKKLKHGLRFASSLITAGVSLAIKGLPQNNRSTDNPFLALSPWIPRLFVNPADHICAEYIGYFQHRKNMEDMGVGVIEKLATQNSIGVLFMTAIGKEPGEALHLIPSANLSVSKTRSRDFRQAHGIHQWLTPNLPLESKIYEYK